MSNKSNISLPDNIDINDVQKLYNKIDKDREFELMLFNFNNINLSYEQYLKTLEFLSKRAKLQKLEVVNSNSLDINYVNPDNGANYRISIDGVENINKYMKMLHQWKNHVIFRVMANKYLDEGDKVKSEYSILKKVKEKENTIDIQDIYVRARLAEEVEPTKAELEKLINLKQDEILNISFRYKQRVSVYLKGKSKDELDYVKIDLTTTNSSKDINRIENMVPNYELELETKSKKPEQEYFNMLFQEAMLLLKIIQQSNFVTTLSKEKFVIQEYAKIGGLNADKITSLDGRKPESLEIQYVTEVLPNNYAVTDKADGERYFLIILQNRVYLISNNLHVKDTGMELEKKLAKYNGTILDGELIFLPNKNRHIFMAFDCLFNGSKDNRKNPNFLERIKEADDVIANCFILEKQKGYEFKEYKSKGAYNLDDMVKFNEAEIKIFMDNLNHDIEQEKKYPLIRRKYFIPATGAKSWEIFKFSSMLYQKYTEDDNIKCPYLLDGLIYHPLNQDYNTNTRESKFKEYKWKPPTKNSVDLFVVFEKNKDTGKVQNVYDNSDDENIKNKPYRICNLYVGKVDEYGVEQPVPFREQEDGSKTYILLQDGEVRDLEGKILADKTVVEFYYNDDASVNPKFRWIPLRTRYDKTEAVLRYRKQYGNYITVANKVWRSIVNPVLMSDMTDLAKGNDEKSGVYYYDKKLDSMRQKIGKDIIISSNKENAYYQVKNNIAKPWRAFNNFIKSIMIYTHCNPMYVDNKQLTILDMGCGRGGDILKYYYAKVQFCLGIDYNKENLLNPLDGAISRYSEQKKRKPNFPKMEFIQADAGSLFNYDDQFRALGGMSNDNKQIMEKYFSKDEKKRYTFDRINCQFVIHYMFKNDDTFANLKQNIRDYLKPGGFMMVSTFDAEKIVEALGDKDKYTIYYTTPKGEKKILFEIIKKFGNLNTKSPIGVGNAIDFYGAWMFQEGHYETEYLVDRRYIEKEFLEECDLELIDTDLFDNQYELHKDFITNYTKYESVDETRKFLGDVKEFYKEDEVNVGCRINDSMTRYYIFRRKDKVTEKKPAKQSRQIKKSQKGGDCGLNLFNEEKFMIKNVEQDDLTYFRSVYDLFKTHKIIPKSETFEGFLENFKVKVGKKKNVEFDEKFFKEFNKSLKIVHENGDIEQTIINGINAYVINIDSGEYDIKIIDNNKKMSVVMIKEGNQYRPLYKKSKKGVVGIFNEKDELINELDSMI